MFDCRSNEAFVLIYEVLIIELTSQFGQLEDEGLHMPYIKLVSWTFN